MDKPVRIRPTFTTRRVLLRTEAERAVAIRSLENAPLDQDFPLEYLLREEVKVRKQSQNDLMWAGPLKDIAEQVWANNRQYSDEVWHELFNEWFLPDPDAPDFDPTHVKDAETYRKWDYRPDGKRVLVGSSTRLSVKGFAVYLEQIYAFGAERGVEYSAAPNERMAA